jgi:DNA-damage-inducible protein J
MLGKELIVMAKNTTINLRVDSEVKEQSGRILDAMGLTFSDAFNLLLHQIRIQRALPFDVVAFSHVPKSETANFIDQIENGTEQLVGPFSSKEELWRSLGI